jgi:hypothetical protein
MSKLFKIVARMHCLFCGSCRTRIVVGGDDRGPGCYVRCDKCESCGPLTRSPIGHDSHHDVTNELRAECAFAWDSVWNHVPNPPAAVTIYLNEKGDQVEARARRRRRPAKAKATVVRAPALEAPAYASALAKEHTAVVIPAPKTTSGQNGLNGHGGAL